MDQSAVLIGFAQACLVLTGFVAVFVTFYSGKYPPSKPDIHHALSMLVGSVLALLMSLAPLVLAAYGLAGVDLWYWSSAFAFGLTIVHAATMLNLTLRLTRAEFKEAGIVHMVTSYSLGTAGSALMLVNVLGDSGPGAYLLGMILVFMVALVGFVTFSVQNFLSIDHRNAEIETEPSAMSNE